MKSKSYTQGYNSYKEGLKWVDNPYPHGSSKWVQWNNGRSDKADEGFLKIVKENPNILNQS